MKSILTISHWLFWPILCALCAAGVLSETKSGFGWIDPSETFHHVRELTAGRVPYRDFFTHHFVGYLFPFYAIDSFRRITPEGFWVLALTYNFMTCVFIGLAVQEAAGPRWGKFAAAVAATIGWYPAWNGALFVNQSYYAPALAAYLWLLLALMREWSLVRAALCAGVAGLLAVNDQRLIPFSLLILVPLLTRQFYFLTLRRVLAVGGAWLAIPGLFLIYLLFTNALQPFIEQCFMFPLVYRNTGQPFSIFDIGASLALQAWSLDPLTPILAIGGLACYIGSRAAGAEKLLVSLFFCLSAAAAVTAKRDFIHYLLFMGPICTYLIALLPYNAGPLFPKLRLPLAAAILTFGAVLGAGPLIRYLKYGSAFAIAKTETIDETVRFLTEDGGTAPDVFVWGYAPQIYLELGSLSRFRDLCLFSVVGANYSSLKREDQGIMQTMEEELRVFFAKHPPRYVVAYDVNGPAVLERGYHRDPYRMPTVPQPQFDYENIPHLAYFKNILENQYVPVKMINNEADWARIFKLKDG